MSSRSSSASLDDRKSASYRSSSSRSRSRSPQYPKKHKKHHHKRTRKHERDQYEDDDHRSRKRDSDVENRHHHHKRRHHSPARIKDEPDSDDDRVRVKREHSADGRVRVKRERSEDGGRVRVKHEPSDDRRSRQRHDMQQQRHDRRQNDRHREERRQRSPFPSENPAAVKEEEPAEKDKPNFGLSGKLTEETNTFRGVVIKYSEPPEARKPRKRWRFYPFKGDQALPVLHISRQSAYLLGRDRKIADMPIDHPSCSKQHAALQYRLVEYERPDGTMGRQVRPYIIDLESANGTYVNNKRIDPKRYVELQEKDVLKFGFSTREYVLLHDKTSTDELGSDHGSESEQD